MKKLLLTVIVILILIFSSVLVYHLATTSSHQTNKNNIALDTTAEISTEIDELFLEENDEIDIGEMI